ncbi:MAG TPA: mannitol dehydrogenase family protein [Sphingomicrobium sp.]|nr:mannitol dehydrogenase family protein [Sphingomicrobium sp.]
MIEPPPYHRSALSVGIVHFGPGAFHRAHLADYVDRLLHNDPRWAIAAVSLRSPATIEALARQDGLYTLAILDRERRYRLLCPHRRFLGPGQDRPVRELLGDPAVRIVSSTVTEKGYCLAADGSLDFDHPDIRRDLSAPDRPGSLIGWLALGLADRRAQGLPPFVPLCCDNMSANGTRLKAAVIAFAGRIDPGLADWIGGEVRFPDTMVDSITPATTDELRREVREATGFDDLIPVAREAYSAFVIEDVLPGDAPDLKSVGARLSSDVAGWEKAKLRMLNGAHSTFAYLGLLIGYDTVAEAMDEDMLAGFVERLMRDDIAASLSPSPIDLDSYADEILDRFRNPAIGHKLAQIAWDGSQKLPYRLLDPAAEALAAGRPISRLAVPVAAWMLFIEARARAGEEIIDPLSAELARIGRSGDVVARLLGLEQIFPERLARNSDFRSAVSEAAEAMRSAGPRAFLAAKAGE